ncbi:MAG: hypothetical protein ACAH11_08065 [Sphingomonas sp.]
MKRLLLALLVLAGASPVLAADQGNVYDKTWTSGHWAVIATFMDKPRRVAAVLDRESIVTTANDGREFNFVTISEGNALGTGIVGRVKIECKTMVMASLGKTKYYGGEGDYSTDDDIPPVALKPDAAIYPAVRAACTGDLGKMLVIDGDEATMRRETFP